MTLVWLEESEPVALESVSELAELVEVRIPLIIFPTPLKSPVSASAVVTPKMGVASTNASAIFCFRLTFPSYRAGNGVSKPVIRGMGGIGLGF